MEELANFRDRRIQTDCRVLPLLQQGVTVVVPELTQQVSKSFLEMFTQK